VNPFLINNYQSPAYFCDREEETKLLLGNIQNQGNTAFFAQRRLGKTALVQHAFYLLRKKKVTCIYLDIYATQSLRDFTNSLANSIYQVFPENKSAGKRFLEAIRVLRPILSIDEMTGSPQLTLDITQPRQFEKTIPQLLQFLDSQKVNTVIAIDEFQQILTYPEKNVEALLRTAIQPLKNVQFIFCGSNHKMMHQIFNSAKKPFYASTLNINLQKISNTRYAAFIRHHFEINKIRISADAVQSILDLTCTHTYYTQRLCHNLFSSGEKSVKPETVAQALNEILLQSEGTFFQYRNLLTPGQWNLMRALALEEKVEKPYAQTFIYSYRLGTSAKVKRGLEALQEKEMVYYQNALKSPYFEVEDKFLMRWLQRI
jgi:AAA+ ATPase superfamily predicted ATPase